MTKIAISGFGRTGRQAFKAAIERNKDLEFVAINDLTDAKTLAHLLKYDSNYGTWEHKVEVGKDSIIVNGKKIKVLAESKPANLPWKELGVDIVLECTGRFTDRKGASEHLKSGAKKVIISAPAEEPDVTLILGVNEDDYNKNEHHIISNASCTTNCLAPVVKVLQDRFGIVKGFMSTIHSFTMDQMLQDNAHKDLRRARAATSNIIPTSTGAAKAIFEVVAGLEGKLDGLAYRVPTSTVSVIDLTCLLERQATAEEVNKAFREVAESSMKGVLGVSTEPLVSSDYKKTTYSAVLDLLSTKVLEKNLVHLVAWYDNEWGYSCRLADLASYIGKKGF